MPYTKEQAIQAMSEWVQHPNEFGKVPDSAEVIREENILGPEGKRAVIYLVRFEIEGVSHVGCTGEGLYTWYFRNINFENFEHDELIEMYVGWMLAMKEKEAKGWFKPKPKTPTESEKKKFLQTFENSMDLGEDLEILEATSLGGTIYYCVSCGGWGVVTDAKVHYYKIYEPEKYGENPWLMIYHYFGWQFNPLDKND